MAARRQSARAAHFAWEHGNAALPLTPQQHVVTAATAVRRSERVASQRENAAKGSEAASAVTSASSAEAASTATAASAVTSVLSAEAASNATAASAVTSALSAKAASTATAASAVTSALSAEAASNATAAMAADINLDALQYSNQINETCIFHTCAVCAVTDGLKQLRELTVELKDSVSTVLLSAWVLFQQNVPADVVASLEQPGYLIGAKHICKKCCQSVEYGDIPKRALINGYCTGTVPRVLEDLNRSEISMIAIVNPIVKLELHSGGLKSRTDVISYANNVAAIAQKLPRLPAAILRSKSRSVQHYRPQFVFAALNWLKLNNRLYDAVTLDFPEKWANVPCVIIPEIIFDEENHCDDVDGNATNPSAVEPQDTFVLDETCRSSISTMTDLVMERTDGCKIQRHLCDNYDGMAFPLLYPYGVGFPAGKDINFAYVNHRIRCGGPYKRFAETTDWLFTHYSCELRMKNAAQAAKMQQHKDQFDGNDRILLINYLKSNITDLAKMTRIRQILKLVQPYASVIPGSVLAMEQERNRLRSLVTSPVTTKDGHWRWFFTQAQSDLHSPYIYDNVVDSYSCNDSIEDRHAKTDALMKDQRRQLLLKNPVVAVRVWKLQQRAFFDCIINGCSKPLGGEVTYGGQNRVSSQKHHTLALYVVHSRSQFDRTSSRRYVNQHTAKNN